MKINIFLLCYNEELLLPLTLKFYRQRFPSAKFILVDNYSTDRSCDIAKENNMEIRQFLTQDCQNEEIMMHIRNTIWNDVTDGWIIMCDMDEWLEITEEQLFEEENRGTTIITTKGINIVGESKKIDLSDIDIFNLNNEEVFRAIHKLDEIKYDISTIYKLWKDAEFKKSIIIMLKVIYLLDVINTISKLKKSKNWTLPEYLTDDGETKIWGMGNPLLDDNQIFNPISLDKNIIITGVNAGGKTTYVKSIAANIILAQTFGIVNGCKAKVLLYDAIISFMRVRDEVGVKSYFEAETDCCNQMIMIATDLYERKKKGLFILDEPMHSTPPIEGMSVAHAIAKYLGSLKGITTIITTHFHNLISLGDNNRFINLSVNAIEDNGGYKFDYKIRKGASKQTIAIELLKKQKFNDEIINSAIEIKNKLCNENLRYDL